MFYTLGEAAKATGKSKPAIAKSIEKGRISASKGEFGQWQIDPAELHRVYPKIATQVDETEPPVDPKIMVEMERLKGAVERLEALNRQLEGERDNLRGTVVQLTGLLTDQRAKEAPERKAGPWWGFWRNRG